MEQIKPFAYLIPDFCRAYTISRSSFYREVREGRLQLFKRGRRSLIASIEAERWFAELQKNQYMRSKAVLEA